MLILCTMVYVFFILIDVIPIAKAKRWKVLAIYSVIITTAYIFTILNELGVIIPSPANLFKRIIESITGGL